MKQDANAKKLSIVIADDHTLVRDGIRSRLELEDDLVIVAEAADGLEAVEMTRLHKPDILMLDISMPRCNGLEAARKIREENQDCRILFLSMHDNPEYIQAAIKVGANGFLLKDVSSTGMAAAISSVAGGGFYFSNSISLDTLNEPPQKQETNVYNLTDREIDVLKGIAEGKANKEIAAKLGIGVRTVESHRQRMREKIGGGNAAQLTHIAMEMGLLDPTTGTKPS
ncbi:two component transcriptional regulator, LuxR family [Cohaesibacter sp. ES.047]|uniref:response regulator transcription factor n=1 Tax=Cohaesibacter sp. ES.047 TaxID=1798205 RepID=UPI000BB9803F|nr:response regulator transcription factor [Cohaesibacter sp. ES.047]SNY90917.1 two component transcriptional regulator, LuxR family [Cohaesibacter sp. ES.047]